MNVSDKIPQNSYTISNVRRGDDSLIFTVGDGDKITEMGDDFLNILIFSYDGTVEQNSAVFGSSTAKYFSQVIDDESQGSTGSDEEINNGQITVGNLTNGDTYNLSFSKVNKFLFLSNISNSKVGAPQDIQTFLDEQGCYLLSAGFQTNHYVLDYLRDIRDQYLIKVSWGRDLVSFYYNTAPDYTSFIIESPVLSFIMRAMGYFIYFIFKFWYFLAILPIGFVVRRKIVSNHLS